MNYKNILIIRQSALGDVANILPVLSVIRESFPHARISCLTAPLTADLLTSDPCVDAVIVQARSKKPSELLPCFYRLYAEKFDLVIDLQSSRHSRWLTLATMAGTRLGHGRTPFYTEPVQYDPSSAQACELFQRIIDPLGLEQTKPEPRFPNLAEARVKAEFLIERLALNPKAIVVLNPGHSPEWVTKRWPAAHWLELIERFAALGLTPIITGGPGDAKVADELCRESQNKAVSLAGKTRLDELAGVMSLARVVVSTDSGPMHVAAMSGATVIALFGPTNPVPSAPLGDKHRILHRKLDCSLCFKKICPYNHECLDELLPAIVWGEVADILTGNG